MKVIDPSQFQIMPDSGIAIATLPTAPPVEVDKDECKDVLKDTVASIAKWQRKLYAEHKRALLLIFQAMDAAGKDSTIRAVSKGVNPAGYQVYSFKRPSDEEVSHDFLWRTSKRLPLHGRIGIFNRSYYEEVLVVRVHPHYLQAQGIDPSAADDEFWQQRFASIRDHEAHLSRNGTRILKFWLNVSPKEQTRRLLRRIDRPDKNWKFNAGDLRERALWPQYMQAYQSMLQATSTKCAPWYAIPADNKPWMRMQVANIIAQTLAEMAPDYPALPPQKLAELDESRQRLLES